MKCEDIYKKRGYTRKEANDLRINLLNYVTSLFHQCCLPSINMCTQGIKVLIFINFNTLKLSIFWKHSSKENGESFIQVCYLFGLLIASS